MWWKKGVGVTAQAQIAVLGCTFKPNINDMRNSKEFDLIAHLRDYSFNVLVVDLFAREDHVLLLYNEQLVSIHNFKNKLDILILAVGHEEYLTLSEEELPGFFKNKMFIYDISNSPIPSSSGTQNEISSL